MKANEMPKRIYLFDYNEAMVTPLEGDTVYVREDAFIEKALKWYCLDCECNDNCNADHKCFFRQHYKRFLEGNDKALPPKEDNAINPDGSTTENYRYRHIIRKMQDAFIEKACEYLESKVKIILCGDKTDTDKFINKFRKYMKGE